MINYLQATWHKRFDEYCVLIVRNWKVATCWVQTTGEVLALADALDLPVVSRCVGEVTYD